MKMLKRLTSIFLLSTLLITQTELKQLLKFPLLITHYMEHKKEKPEMSVGTFIRIHYLNKFIKDKDFMQDMRLPFKSDVPAQAFFVPSAVIPQNLYISIRASVFDFNCGKPDYSEKVIRGIPGSVWQPPQMG